jgi:hypothetical protein
MASDEPAAEGGGGAAPQKHGQRSVTDLLWLWPVLGIALVSVVGTVADWLAAAVTAALLVVLAGTALAWTSRSRAGSAAAFVVAAAFLGGLLSRQLAKNDRQVPKLARTLLRPVASAQPAVSTAKDLRGARLAGQHLAGIDLRDRHLEGVQAEGTLLAGAMLANAQLQGAWLAGADLRGASLRNACLRGADLTGARLNGADLTGADLKGVVGLAKHRYVDRRGAVAGRVCR